MSSTFGTLLKVSTFGESHGMAVGTVLDDNRVADVLYADLVDCQFARIGRSLNVRNRGYRFRCRFAVHAKALVANERIDGRAVKPRRESELRDILITE